MQHSRRDVGLFLPVVAAFQASAQEGKLPSQIFEFESLTARPSGPEGKNKARSMFNGKTHAGFSIEMHQTELAPGMAPHPPHHHAHEELILVWQGTVEVTIAGKTAKLGPGSSAYVASGDEHGWRNVGSTKAIYYVMALRGNA